MPAHLLKGKRSPKKRKPSYTKPVTIEVSETNDGGDEDASQEEEEPEQSNSEEESSLLIEEPF